MVLVKVFLVCLFVCFLGMSSALVVTGTKRRGGRSGGLRP